jgi:hypothetical protein
VKKLICSKCGLSRDKGRTVCRECHLELQRNRSRKRYREKGRKWYFPNCLACGENYKSSRKRAKFCPECRKDRRVKISEDYVRLPNPGKTLHREIAQNLLGRKLNYHEVVHHLDENPKNNELTNLIIISRKMHGRLHQYLDNQRVILLKSGNENFENCWNSLRVPMTTTWLETASVKVIKLWEIGQSAGEPLKEKSQEEASETMHEAS